MRSELGGPRGPGDAATLIQSEHRDFFPLTEKTSLKCKLMIITLSGDLTTPDRVSWSVSFSLLRVCGEVKARAPGLSPVCLYACLWRVVLTVQNLDADVNFRPPHHRRGWDGAGTPGRLHVCTASFGIPGKFSFPCFFCPLHAFGLYVLITVDVNVACGIF